MLTQRSRPPQRQRRTFGAPGVRRLARDFNLNLALSGHASRAPQCLLLAQSGHFATEFQCLLLGVKQTSYEGAEHMAMFVGLMLDLDDAVAAKRSMRVL